jgi:hypothetical protein
VKGVVAWIKLYPFRIWLAFALAVVASLVIGIVRSSGPAPGPQQPASAQATTPPAGADAVTGQVTAAGLTLNHPGGASLSVPAGALPVGTVVAVTRGSAAPLRQLGALQPDGVSWDVAASVEPPSLPVTLVIPYDPAAVPAGARPLVTTYDELSGWWVPVKTTAVPATGKLIAELPGFSLKTWILDRLPGQAGSQSWLEYQGQARLPPRSDRPQCAGRAVPPWVRQVVVNPGTGVSACVRGDGDGFAIEAADTRPYPVTLDLDAPAARIRSTAIDTTMDSLLGQLPGGVLMLPSGKSTIGYAPPPAPVGTVRGRVRRDGDTMVRWLVFEAARIAPAARTAVGTAAVACGKRALSGPALAAQRVAVLLDCLAQALQTQLRKSGFDVAGGLWRPVGATRLPAAVAQTAGALRWVRGLQAGNFAALAGELAASGGEHGTADRPTLLVRWAGAPRWARPPGVTPLFSLVSTASVPGPTGQRTSARLAGRSYPDSTGAWVACADPPATLTYHLAKKFRRLTAVAGLAEFAPPDLAVRFQLTADGRTVASHVVDHRATATIDLDVSNVDSLVISAVRTAGSCPPSPRPFGVLGEASLFS